MSESKHGSGQGGSLSGELTPNGHRLFQRVYFEDTDFSGVVYHARYLNFIERGRSDFLRLLGVHHSDLAAGEVVEGEALTFAVRRMSIDFKKPARIDDILEITTHAASLSGARLSLEQAVLCEGELLVSAEVEVVMIDMNGRPKRMPDAIAAAFAGLVAD